ncbi:MAG: asparaginase [Christensenellaceae bacterium]|nr:asparaginase [Christensenellaceae bacterium]
MINYQILSYEYRGNVLDLSHMGNIAIVDKQGNIICSVGEPDTPTCYRSASKPIQALPTIALGNEYNLSPMEQSIFSGSQTGEILHTSVLESILNKTGLKEEYLIMKPCYPADEKHRNSLIVKGMPKRKIYHNCAGKHIAAMLLQRALGGKVEEYWQENSPVQQAIKKAVCILSEVDDAVVSTDGCGVPVFTVPLKNIAIAYKNLACINTIKDEILKNAARYYIPILHQNPIMLRGTGYFCTLMNMDSNIIAKGGANGVYGFGIKDKGVGVAFKLADGTEDSWTLIAIEILKILDSLSPEHEERLLSLKPYEIYNDNNNVVGKRVPAFKLKGDIKN